MASKNDGKQIGEPCAYCGKPLTQGKYGPYCNPCYVNYKNSQGNKQTTIPTVSSDAEGKVRHAFALEAYKKDKTLNVSTASEIDKWVNFVMNHKLAVSQTEQPEPPQDLPEIQADDIPF